RRDPAERPEKLEKVRRGCDLRGELISSSAGGRCALASGWLRLSLRTSLRPLRFLLFGQLTLDSYRLRMVTPPFVVITRTRAPPDPSVVVNRSLSRPWTVIGKSTLMRPLT